MSPMTRMQKTERLLCAFLAGLAVLFLAAAPVNAQILPTLPEAPVDIDHSTGVGTPLGHVSADASEDGARVCTDASADGDALVSQATGLAGGLPVGVPALPVDTPTLPAAGADACLDADIDELRVGAEACADADRLDGATDYAKGQLPTELPGLPVDASSAAACADASADADDGTAEAGAQARAGPVEQGYRKAVDAFSALFSAIGGLF